MQLQLDEAMSILADLLHRLVQLLLLHVPTMTSEDMNEVAAIPAATN